MVLEVEQMIVVMVVVVLFSLTEKLEKNLNKISSVFTANACATGETGKMMR